MTTYAEAEGSWDIDQVLRIFQAHPELAARALQQALAQDAELTWSLAVSLYLDEEISLSKAAELIGVHPLVLRERFLESGIPLWLGAANEPEAAAEVHAARRWLQSNQDEPRP